jgi:hypothetical protein
MFQRYVASVSYECSKSRSGCCICYNGYTHMLQVSVPNVSSVFSDVCCKCVYLDVAYVSHICCKCFIWILHMFCNGFSNIFRCFCKCFRCVFYLSLDVFANVSSGCFKSRIGIAHVAMMPVAGGQRPTAGLQLLPRAFLVWRASSSPLLSLPFLSFSPSRHGSSSLAGKPYPTSTQTPVEVEAPGGLMATRCLCAGLGAS